jgi:hypothetical protein
VAGLEVEKRGSGGKVCGQSLEMGKGKGIDYSLELPERRKSPLTP